MKIYLVRHGQTNGNLAKRHQIEKTPLTFKGEEQALEVAKVIKELKPTHLITSTLLRAIDTAKVIGEDCGLVPETNPLFVELVRPSYLHGRHHISPSSLVFYSQWYFGISRNASGESYETLRMRFAKVREYLSSFPQEARVVVVSHSVFINLLVAHLNKDSVLWPHQALWAFWKLYKMPNTGIVSLSYDFDQETGTGRWSVDS